MSLPKKYGIYVATGIGGALIIVLGLGLFFCTKTIPQGTIGVVYDRFAGGVQEETLKEGINFVKPWTKVNEFPISTEVVYMTKDKKEGSEENDSITVSCSDGALNADLTYNYHFKAEDAPKVQKKFRGRDGREIMDQILRGQIKTWVSEVTKNYSTMEVHLTDKDKINTEITRYLNKKVKDYGMEFESVALSETRPSDKVKKAIEQRQQIAQEVEQQKLNLQKAEVAKQQAELEAQKKVIAAEGEKKANEIMAQGLDEKILEKLKIEKWDGKLPTYQGNGTPMINLK